MNNISISKKIGLILVASITFSLLVSFMSYITMSSISNDTKNIAKNSTILKNQAVVLNTYATNLQYQVTLAKSIAIETLLKKKNVLANNDYVEAKKSVNNIIKQISLYGKKFHNKKIVKDANILRKKAIAFFMILESLQEEFDADVQDGIEVLNEDVAPIEAAFNKLINSFVSTSDKNFKNKMSEMAKDLQSVNETVASSNVSSIVFNLISIILSTAIGIYIMKNITSAVEAFQTGIIGFFKYLNKETTQVVHLDDSSKDEIGTMAKIVNDNINKTSKLLQEDTIVIEEVKKAVEIAKTGLMSQKVDVSTSNKELENLKQGFNELLNIVSTKVCGDLNKISTALEHYGKLDFTHRITGNLGEVSKGLNTLADIINQMLVENKENGIILDRSSVTLLNNVDSLSQSSTKAASSLEETADSIGVITDNISQNTQNVIKMAGYANIVTNSVNEGQSLAKQTTQAMNEIDAEVNAINEAITVIDQIAFQTNILSLNAAVEAATAGEAGKGFAVVAQEVRNLASRSAEAANEIKKLVENATNKANNGKQISSVMIKGYEELNENISKTIELITEVENVSKAQYESIEAINHTVSQIVTESKHNASIAATTHDVARETQDIAQKIVEDVNKKNFIGKDNL